MGQPGWACGHTPDSPVFPPGGSRAWDARGERWDGGGRTESSCSTGTSDERLTMASGDARTYSSTSTLKQKERGDSARGPRESTKWRTTDATDVSLSRARREGSSPERMEGDSGAPLHGPEAADKVDVTDVVHAKEREVAPLVAVALGGVRGAEDLARQLLSISILRGELCVRSSSNIKPEPRGLFESA